MRMGFTASLSGRQETRLDLNARLTARKTFAMQVSAIARTGCAHQMQLVDMLIASGMIVVDNESEAGEYDDVAEDEENEFDSEAERLDDDELHDEADPPSAHVAPVAGDVTPLDPLLQCYEIRIVKGARGWTCIPPRNPLLGYRACGHLGQQAVEAMSAQFGFYSSVAKWLRDEGDAVLANPAALGSGHMPKTKKAFSGEIGIDDTTVGYYCRNCRLSWRDASLPLDSLFR